MTEPHSDEQRAARAPRRDAAANRERVLAAAAIAVRRDGEKVPMATIAAEAGVGIGTLYRHYPTRPALLAALAERSYELVLTRARGAGQSDQPVLEVISRFFEQIIAVREDLFLPLHGGPISLDKRSVALRTEISDLLEQVLERGRQDETIRSDVSAIDIIIAGAMFAQPLPRATNWDQLARRQAGIYVSGLAAGPAGASLPGSAPTRPQLEAGFARHARAARPSSG